jgi:hypothetical protein
MKKKKVNRHEEEMNRLYDHLSKLQPGTEEYDKVLAELTKAKESEIEIKKIGVNKHDLIIKVGSIVLTTFVVPVLTYGLNRSMVKHIGTIEQMETFTSTAGRKMIPDFFKRH